MKPAGMQRVRNAGHGAAIAIAIGNVTIQFDRVTIVFSFRHWKVLV